MGAMTMKEPSALAEPALRPLSTRSVVLSLLLGAHPPELPVRELVRSVAPFGIAESTVRAALSRMVAAGDLDRIGSTYRLSGPLIERQRRQDAVITPRTRAWRGDWEMAVVTVTGRSAADRAQTRADLLDLRLAELREGVWLRPDNLDRPWPARVLRLVQRFTARPDEAPRALAAQLWPLGDWSATADALLTRFRTATRPADRFTIMTAVVRHLVTDPVLPGELLPDPWPAAELRRVYAGYQREMTGHS
jgi:phenylacetic acid degradation operon negative regulatory protein